MQPAPSNTPAGADFNMTALGKPSLCVLCCSWPRLVAACCALSQPGAAQAARHEFVFDVEFETVEVS